MTPPAHETRADRPTFAYLLLTHSRPDQVEELGDRLLQLSPSADLVVHHDASSPDPPWKGRPADHIHFVERGNVLWGDWSMIDATLRLFRFSLDNLASEWFVLLSGDHRPTTDLQAWEDAVLQAPSDAYLPAERLSGRLRFGRSHVESNLYLTRGRHRWRTVPRPRSPGLHRGIGGLMKLSQWVQPFVALEFVHRRDAWAIGIRRNTRSLGGLPFYRGSQWIAVNRRAALAALKAEPRFTEWFKRSWIPDETYIHTVLRAGDLRVSDSPTTFVLETPTQPTTGWMQLTLDDLPSAWESNTPFARKVDISNRPEVAAAIDEVVDRRRVRNAGEASTAPPQESSHS